MELTNIQLFELIELLRAAGVTSYRNGDLELKLGAVASQEAAEESASRPEQKDEVMSVLSTPSQYDRLYSMSTRKAGSY